MPKRTRTHWFKVSFKRDGDAFFTEDGAFSPASETNRILDNLKRTIETFNEDPRSFRILDLNGNAIGEAEWQ